MSQSVIVLLEKGRRQRVAVTRHTPILLVLEEVCRKQGLNSDDYDLKFHNRVLDHASTIQFCGISNNAQLELVPVTKSRVQTPISIFLQLEDGQRLSGSFLPACTLWHVINRLCDERTKAKENPVIIYTRQEVYGDKLKTTTLKMLGLTSGSALLRLIHRTKEQLKNQSVSTVYKLKPKPKIEKEEKMIHSSRKNNLNKSSTNSEECYEDVKLDIKAVEVTGPMDIEVNSDIINQCNLLERDEQKDMLLESLTQTGSKSKNIPGHSKNTCQPTSEYDRDSKGHPKNGSSGFKNFPGYNQDTTSHPDPKYVLGGFPSVSTNIPQQIPPPATSQPVTTMAGGLTHANINVPQNACIESLCQSNTSYRYKQTDDDDPLFDVNDVQYIGERYALMFRLDTVQSPKFEDTTDEFYDLTVEDAKALLRDIRRTRSELEEAAFETSACKARKKSIQMERTLNLYPHSVVRIIFPNRLVLQGIFKSREKIIDVMKFVRSFLSKSDLVFYLYVSPPKTILQDDQKLVEVGGVPGINFYFGSEAMDHSSPTEIVKEVFIQKSVSPQIAFKVANYFRKAGKKLAIDEETTEIVKECEEDPKPSVRPAATRSILPKKAPSGKVPKWFKMP